MQRVTISDPSAVEVLLDLSKTRLLAPFMHGPQTVAAVAEMTGQAQAALAYWVKRFVGLGLLAEVGRSRPARYQAVAPVFIVDPSRVMPLDDMLGSLNRPAWVRLLQGFTQEYRRISPDWLVELRVNEDGLLSRRQLAPWELDHPTPAPELPLNEWGVIQLSRDQARELKGRLEALLTEYFEAGPADPEADVYVLHLALTRDAVHG